MGTKFEKGVKEVVSFTSRLVEDWELNQLGAHIVCEDPRLSIYTYSKEYKAVDLKLCRQDIPVMRETEFSFMLDLAAAALDIENAATSGPAERRIQRDVMQSEGFMCARQALRGAT